MINAEELQNLKIIYTEIPEYNPGGEYEGIKAITYDGANIGDKKTKVFAYLGYPEKSEAKVPAIVLIHGGGGVPFLEWVKMWNNRGYAAIAMSTTGDFPKTADTGAYPEKEGGHKKPWNFGMHGIFEETEYVNSPDNDEMKNSEKPLTEQWMYHALSQVILANNILHDDSRIDKNKIGITGISWGGVITSLAIGYDKRFAFAIPIYGSGYLAESMGMLGDFFRSGKNPDMWLAEKRFCNAEMPILWLCWNADTAFSLNSNSKSYIDTIKNNKDTRLSTVHKMGHAHWCGWRREESFVFADSVCKGGKKLPFADKNGKIENPDDVRIVSLKIYYITEEMSYVTDENGLHMVQQWEVSEEKTIPAEAKEYYFEVVSEFDGTEYVTSSELIKSK